jgi:hypothetical protein
MVIADIEADLLNYADYDMVGSVARARLYVVAARNWLTLRAESASNQGSSLSLGKSFVAEQLKRAESYVAANATGSSGGRGGVRFLGVGSSFR